MIHNKKGLSTVVTTLIIILLVLVAIGIIWIVVRSVIDDSAEQIDINSKCVSTNLQITNATCDVSDDTCALTVNKAGGYAIQGVVGVVSNPTATSTADKVTGDIIVSSRISIDVDGTLDTLVATTEYTVSLAGYFRNDAGEDITCPQVSEIKVIAVA